MKYAFSLLALLVLTPGLARDYTLDIGSQTLWRT